MNSKGTIKHYLHTATITPEIVAVFHFIVLQLILKQLCLCIQEYITKWPLLVYGPPPYNEGILYVVNHQSGSSERHTVCLLHLLLRNKNQ